MVDPVGAILSTKFRSIPNFWISRSVYYMDNFCPRSIPKKSVHEIYGWHLCEKHVDKSLNNSLRCKSYDAAVWGLFANPTPAAQIYSQESIFCRSSASSRPVPDLLGATVNSGQNNRSHTAFSKDIAKGTDSLPVLLGDSYKKIALGFVNVNLISKVPFNGKARGYRPDSHMYLISLNYCSFFLLSLAILF